MASDSIDVRIRFLQEGATAINSTLNNLNKQFNNLTRVNASMMASNGRLLPSFAAQATVISQLGGAASQAGKDLVSLKQEGSVFSQIFTGKSSQNIQSLLNQFGGTISMMGALGGKTSWLSSRLSQELGRVKVISDETAGSFRNLTDVERFRIMGHVVGQEMANTTQALLNTGKNLQWVGRQMTVGLTLPIVLAAKSMTMSFLTLNRAQTEFQKYMVQNGYKLKEAQAAFDTTKLGNLASTFEDIAIKTGLYTDEVTNLGAAWVAAGYDVEEAVPKFTMLTAQLNLLAQGEIDQEQSIELIRAVQKSWGLTTDETIDQIKRLNLIAGTTSLTLGEVAASLPLASSAASLLGLSAAELAALFAGMREKGVQANQAANTLKFSINRLVNPTEKANETFQNFFNTQKDITDLFFGRGGQPDGLDGFKKLAEMFATLGEEQQAQLSGQLFGGYRFDRMLKLMQAIREEDSQLNRALAETSAADTAAKAWEKQIEVINESAAQAFKVMKTEFIALAQKIGAMIWPYLDKLGHALLDVLDAFANSPEFVKKFVVAMGVVLAAIGPVTFIVGQLTEAVAMLKKVFLVFPFEKFFALSTTADPFGLLKLAQSDAGRNNPLIQIMAGIPLAEEQITQLTTVTNASLAKTIGTLEALGLTMDSNSIKAMQMHAAIQGGGVGPVPVADMLPFMGPNVGDLLKGKNNLQISEIEKLKTALSPTNLDEILGAQGIQYNATAKRFTSGGSFIAEQAVADSLGLSLDDFRAVRSGEQSLFSIVTDGGSRFLVGGADDFQDLTFDARRLGVIGTRGGTSGLLGYDIMASALGMSRDDFAALTRGEKSLLQVTSKNGLKWAAASTDELAMLAKSGPEAQLAIAAAITGGDSLSDAISKTLTQQTTQGMAKASDDVAAAASSGGFFAKLKEVFTGKKITALGASTTGKETAGVFSFIFGSPAALLAIAGAIGVLIKNWEALWKGLQPAVQKLGRIWGDFAKRVVSLFQNFMKGKSQSESISNAFEYLGEVIGEVAIAVSYLAQWLAALVAFFASNALSGIEIVFSTILNLIRAITGEAGAFGDVISNLAAIFNPFNEQLSTTSRIIAILIGYFVALKVAAAATAIIQMLATAFQNLGPALANVGRAVTTAIDQFALMRTAALSNVAGLTNFQVALVTTQAAAGGFSAVMSSIGAAMTVAMPIVTALALAFLTLYQIFHKTADYAKGFEATTGSVTDSLQELINVAREGGDAGSAIEGTISSVVDRATQVADDFKESMTLIGSAIVSTTQDFPSPSYFKDYISMRQSWLKFMSDPAGASDKTRQQASLYTAIFDDVEAMTQYQEQLNKDTQEWVNTLEMAKLPTADVRDTIKELKGEIKSTLDTLKITTDSVVAGQLLVRLDYLKARLQGVKDSGALTAAMLRDAASGFDYLANGADKANRALEKSQEYMDALSSEMQQLAGAAQDSFMQQFDEQAAAQEEALAQRQENATEALQAAQDRQMAAFEKNADRKVSAIDKKIEAIQKEQEKEDWAQQQEEYRLERQRLIEQQEMSEAMAFAERIKAIHEGRYDDARILELQQLENTSEFNDQMKDLDRKHRDDIKKHVQDKRIARLEKEKEALQKQLDKQREALQKQFDLERKHMEKLQDLQSKSLQERLDNERQFLENMFTELNEQMPKNKKEWQKYWEDVKKLAKENGVSVDGIIDNYTDVWHQSLKQGLHDAIKDAYEQAGGIGGAVGAGIIAGYDKMKAKAMTPEDKKLYAQLADYLQRISINSKNNGMSPEQLKNWLGVLNQSIKIAASGNTQAAHNIVSIYGKYHTGGEVKSGKAIGGKSGEVDARLMRGEYVVNKDSVNKYGLDFMHKINKGAINIKDAKKEYHSGGLVSDALAKPVSDLEIKGLGDFTAFSLSANILSGYIGAALRGTAEITKGFIRGMIAQKEAALPQYNKEFNTNYGYPSVPVSAGNVTPVKYMNHTWDTPPGVPSGGAIASSGGTASERNYYSKLKSAFPTWNISNAGVYVIKQILGTNTWSQHSWGNAVDVVIGSTDNVLSNPDAQAKMDILAGWTAANHSALRVATQLWRANEQHMNHMHVDFWPQGTGSPYGHDGGLFNGSKFKKLDGLKFEGPAILQAGEAVLSRNVVNALNTIGASNQGPQGVNEPTVININLDVHGDMYGDDSSYEKLYNTLERAGSKIARNRGMSNNTVIRTGVR